MVERFAVKVIAAPDGNIGVKIQANSGKPRAALCEVGNPELSGNANALAKCVETIYLRPKSERVWSRDSPSL